MSTQQPCALLFIVEILRNDLISLDRVRFFYLSVKSERDSILITTNFRLTSIAVHIADGHLPPLSVSLLPIVLASLTTNNWPSFDSAWLLSFISIRINISKRMPNARRQRGREEEKKRSTNSTGQDME